MSPSIQLWRRTETVQSGPQSIEVVKRELAFYESEVVRLNKWLHEHECQTCGEKHDATAPPRGSSLSAEY